METVIQALKVAQEVFQIYENPGQGVEFKRFNYIECFTDGINPYYNQTKEGFLIMYGSYGYLAEELHTPYGYIRIGGSGGCYSGYQSLTRIKNRIMAMKDFKLVLMKTSYQDAMGNHGPWYLVVPRTEEQLEIPANLSDCYKDRSETISCDESKRLISASLDEAVVRGVISRDLRSQFRD